MKKVIGFGLLVLLVMNLLGAMRHLRGGHNDGLASVAQTAWTQGYIAGQQAATGEEGATVVPPSFSRHDGFEQNGRFYTPIFPIFGLFFLCLLPLFMIGSAFMFGGRRRWHRHAHGKGGRRGGHRPPWAGGCPPWKRDGEHAPRWMRDESSEDGDDDDLPTADEIHEKSPEDLL